MLGNIGRLTLIENAVKWPRSANIASVPEEQWRCKPQNEIRLELAE